MILWLDLETTGLDPASHYPVEVAAILTDRVGTPLDSMEAVCHVPQLTWDRASPQALKMHQENGLYTLSREATPSAWSVFNRLTHWVEDHRARRQCQTIGGTLVTPKFDLGGNSVHFDRTWLEVFAPRLMVNLTHRHVDVRTLLSTFDAAGLEIPQEEVEHRAMADVRQSLDNYRRVLEILRAAKGLRNILPEA